MTLSELQEKVKKYRRKVRNMECNLFWEKLEPGALNYAGRNLGSYETGLYVAEADGIWKVYECEYERGGSVLVCIFYSESDLYDFIFCCYKQKAEFSGHAGEKKQESEEYGDIKMPKPLPRLSVLGVAAFILALLGVVIWLSIQQKNVWILLIMGTPAIVMLLGFFAELRESWSAYRLAKRNFEVYRAKKWTEMCLCKIRRREATEAEYRFSGKGAGDYIRIERMKMRWQDLNHHHFPNDHTPGQETDAWKISSFNNGENIVRGICSDYETAYFFVFYEIAKAYTDENIEDLRWSF